MKYRDLIKMKRVATRPAVSLARLYLKDETAWLESCARLIQERQYKDLDYLHLRELLLDMAEREKREVRSRLLQLILHMLKWQFQPKNRTKSWRNTILNQREELDDIFVSKTLKNYADDHLADVYVKGVKRAIRETDLDASIFPEECPYSLEFLLSEEFPS